MQIIMEHASRDKAAKRKATLTTDGKLTRRVLLRLSGAAALSGMLGAGQPWPAQAGAGAKAGKPNFVFILTDDLRREKWRK